MIFNNLHFRPRASLILCLFSCLTLSVPAAVHADSPARQASNFASGSGNVLFLAAAVGLPLLSDGSQGRNHSLRVLDSLGTSVLLTEGLKDLVREKRPDTNEHDSFPSGHATAAFAVATTESALHPRQAPLWYLGATLISYSRVRLHRHYDRDVLAGAAIGYGMARLEVSAPHGLLLAPLITADRRTVGLQMSKGF
jgi:membrane-associated phospholipid phosphatase